jgi:hypothetical protein
VDNASDVKIELIPVIDDGLIKDDDLLLRRFIISSTNPKATKQYTNKDKNHPNFHYVSVSSLNYSSNGMSVYSASLFLPYKELWSSFLDCPANEAGHVHTYGLLRFEIGKIRDAYPQVQVAFDEDKEDNHAGRRNSHCLLGLLEPPSRENRVAEKLWHKLATQISSMNPFYEDPAGILHPGEFRLNAS